MGRRPSPEQGRGTPHRPRSAAVDGRVAPTAAEWRLALEERMCRLEQLTRAIHEFTTEVAAGFGPSATRSGVSPPLQRLAALETVVRGMAHSGVGNWQLELAKVAARQLRLEERCSDIHPAEHTTNTTDGAIAALSERLDILERRVIDEDRQQCTAQENLEKQYESLKSELQRVETANMAAHANMQASVKTSLASIDPRFASNEAAVQSLADRLDALASDVSSADAIEAQVGPIRDQIEALLRHRIYQQHTMIIAWLRPQQRCKRKQRNSNRG